MTSREDIHRLVDALSATRLPAVEQLLRASLADTDPTEGRRFASTLSAEHDLAERHAGGTGLPRRRPGRPLPVVDDLEPDLDRIAELVERYADLPLGTVDASVVALTERLELREVATPDHRDFSVVRLRHTAALTLLPQPIRACSPPAGRSVSEVAQSLAEDGCLTDTRGRITITDRPRLQSHACGCYEAIRQATDAAPAAR
jgi:hypothetical protein